MGVAEALIASAVVSAASGASAVIQGERSARRAKRVGRQRAAALRAEAAAERERGRRLAGTQRAAFGAAGVSAAGTPLIVSASSLLENIRARERLLAGARNVRSEAGAQADAFRIQGITGGLQGLAGAVSAVSQLPSASSATGT